MNRRTETEDMIRAELDRHQVIYAFGEGSAHPFVSITGQSGQCRRIAYPGTPSDVRGILNTRAQIRRALREIGAQPWPEERESVRVGSLGAAPGRDHLKLETILKFRIENFGQIADERQPGASDGRGTGPAIAALKRQVSDIETRLRALEDAVTSPRKERF